MEGGGRETCRDGGKGRVLGGYREYCATFPCREKATVSTALHTFYRECGRYVSTAIRGVEGMSVGRREEPRQSPEPAQGDQG
eukprot:3405921-Rhodomonas_salina.2